MLDCEPFSVTCLSGNDVDYLSMWAYYANKSKGFRVEYKWLKKLYFMKPIMEMNELKSLLCLFNIMM